MTIRAEATNPDAVVVDVTLSMTLGEWQDFEKQISQSAYPGSKFCEHIRFIVRKIKTVVTGRLDGEL